MGQESAQSRLRSGIRTFLPSEAKAWLAGILCHPLAGRTIAYLSRNRIRSGRLRIHTDASTISPRTKAQIFWGIYESAEIRMAESHLRADLDLLEIGASLGVVSSHAVSRLSARSRAVCVEANPDLIPTIERNLRANLGEREVLILNRAIDYESTTGSTRLHISTETSGSQLGRLLRSASDTMREVVIPATTIATVVAEAKLREFALLCDIEGAEAGFFLGDTRELAGCRQMIIELHDTEHGGRRLTWQDLLSELTSRFGFHVVDAHGPVQVLER